MRQTTLSQKGIALVLLTLLFQLSFVAALAMLLHNAEEQVRHERSVREVIYQINRLSGLIERSCVGFAEQIQNEDSPQSKRFRETYGQYMEQLPDRLTQLRRLTKDSPYTADVETLCADVEQGRQLMESCRKACLANIPERYVFGASLSRLSRRINTKVEGLLQKYQRAQQQEMDNQNSSRNFVVTALSVGIVLDVVMALFLVITFTNGISKRIERLRDNAIRLAAGKPLQPSQAQNDEIGLLDRTFHQAADILAQAKEKEQAVARLKQEFVAMVTHDLRAPLTSIQLIMEMTEMGNYGELSDVGKKRLRGANEEINRLVELLNGLLSIEKLESGVAELELTAINARRIIDPSVLAVQGAAGRAQVEIEVINPDDPTIEVDAMRVTQVLVNLLSNAIKFSPANTKVQLALEQRDGKVRFEVRDHGRGVPEEMRQSIFDRFTQVERSDEADKKGAGLGLSICKAIVEKHGGVIGVTDNANGIKNGETHPGTGSIFWFELPGGIGAELIT